MTEVFQSNYNLKNSSALLSRGIKTVMYGSETISSSGPQAWDILLTELKYIVSPTLIKKKISVSCLHARLYFATCNMLGTYKGIS